MFLSRRIPKRLSSTTATTKTPKKQPKTGVLMLNLGGPKTTDDVYPFLHRLFSDPDLIPIPFQKNLAPWIARRRTPKIQDQYQKIGGGSPIGYWTERQGELMAAKLDIMSPESAPHKPYIAFRYAPPLTEDTLVDMVEDGVERVVVFTQYPQYSCSTTGSSLNELARKIPKLVGDKIKQWSIIDRWATHEGLVKAYAHLIETHLEKHYADGDRDNVILLFSAHSLPMSVVNRGDTYPGEVAATVDAVMKQLSFKHPYRLVWQSQVGPAPWLGPRTDHALEGLAKAGHKNVVMIPIAFTSDHIETLFELDQEYGELGKELGISGLTRLPALNDNEIFIDALADLVHEHLQDDRYHSQQWLIRCPGCDKDACKNSREFFKEMFGRSEAGEPLQSVKLKSQTA